ncbi:MAG: DNA-protecting protein DprA [Candidatus Eremiobacteraeota bacterium]|nr:DNA-protecting protein DprA [Candidatus Eremiobacteraeota bacterium]
MKVTVMEAPALVLRQTFDALRGERPLPVHFAALWVTGTLDGLRRPTVAIVGTRAATGYGKAQARQFASTLGSAGCSILSGLALGIDAAAHEGALEAGAPTLGVLGSGHSRFFPRRNLALAERMIAAGGGVLSPFEPQQIAWPSQFLQRNGVVAALADAVVVVEAPARSGALNTASWAAGSIPVFAVPGDLDRPQFEGSHALIRDGATLARSPQDVLDELGLLRTRPEPARGRAPRADALEESILRDLDACERGLDELSESTRSDLGRLLAALTVLEIDGAIERRDGARYSLRR